MGFIIKVFPFPIQSDIWIVLIKVWVISLWSWDCIVTSHLTYLYAISVKLIVPNVIIMLIVPNSLSPIALIKMNHTREFFVSLARLEYKNCLNTIDSLIAMYSKCVEYYDQ